MNSSKKQTNEFVFTSMRRIFVWFLEVLSDLFFLKDVDRLLIHCSKLVNIDRKKGLYSIFILVICYLIGYVHISSFFKNPEIT